jgi:protein SCO1/2
MTTEARIRIALLWAVALVALAVLWHWVAAPHIGRDLADNFGHGDYHLVATDGSDFTEDTLTGTPSAVFFGFTHCPEVCPTTLGDVAAWQEALAAEDDRPLRVFFVTVDPERDTPGVLGDYVSWVPGVTGVTGSREEIDKAIAAFRVYAKKVPLDGEDYTMDHSAVVMLFDEDGRFFEPIAYQEGSDRALEKLRRLMHG